MITVDLKIPRSFDEQVQCLITHKMDLADVELAKRILSEVNYYRLSGYALQFRDKANPDDYVPGTKFENRTNKRTYSRQAACFKEQAAFLISSVYLTLIPCDYTGLIDDSFVVIFYNTSFSNEDRRRISQKTDDEGKAHNDCRYRL